MSAVGVGRMQYTGVRILASQPPPNLFKTNISTPQSPQQHGIMMLSSGQRQRGTNQSGTQQFRWNQQQQQYSSLKSIPEDDLTDFSDDDWCSLKECSSPIPNSSSLPQLSQEEPPHVNSLVLDALGLVDRERLVSGLDPFRLSYQLNAYAYQHAAAMAKLKSVFHTMTTIDELMLFLSSIEVAENVQRGESVLEMHEEAMNHVNPVNRSNILSPHFTEYGCAVVRGQDGKLYSCQLFRGESCTTS